MINNFLFDFFFLITWDLGASGSCLLTFLSNLPIEAVDIYASERFFINAFLSLFLALSLTPSGLFFKEWPITPSFSDLLKIFASGFLPANESNISGSRFLPLPTGV